MMRVKPNFIHNVLVKTILILNIHLYLAQATFVSAEIFGSLPSHEAPKIPENGNRKTLTPQDQLVSNKSDVLASQDPQDLAISHPFLGESSARVPLILYNPLARKVGFSTLMLSSLLYGLTIIPALLSVSGYDPFGGSGLFPLAIPALIGAFAGRKRRRRSIGGDPMETRTVIIDLDKIKKVISILESPFGVGISKDSLCSKNFLCKRVEMMRQSLVRVLQNFLKNHVKRLYGSEEIVDIVALPKESVDGHYQFKSEP